MEMLVKDGIDRKALSATLRALEPEERRQSMRQFAQWTREASRAVGWRAYIGFLFVCAALVMTLVGLRSGREGALMIPLSAVVLGLGSLLNLDSRRRAREWRRAHPFEQWRATPPISRTIQDMNP